MSMFSFLMFCHQPTQWSVVGDSGKARGRVSRPHCVADTQHLQHIKANDRTNAADAYQFCELLEVQHTAADRCTGLTARRDSGAVAAMNSVNLTLIADVSARRQLVRKPEKVATLQAAPKIPSAQQCQRGVAAPHEICTNTPSGPTNHSVRLQTNESTESTFPA